MGKKEWGNGKGSWKRKRSHNGKGKEEGKEGVRKRERRGEGRRE